MRPMILKRLFSWTHIVFISHSGLASVARRGRADLAPRALPPGPRRIPGVRPRPRLKCVMTGDLHHDILSFALLNLPTLRQDWSVTAGHLWNRLRCSGRGWCKIHLHA
jgi:hypothetical protein